MIGIVPSTESKNVGRVWQEKRRLPTDGWIAAPAHAICDFIFLADWQFPRNSLRKSFLRNLYLPSGCFPLNLAPLNVCPPQDRAAGRKRAAGARGAISIAASMLWSVFWILF